MYAVEVRDRIMIAHSLPDPFFGPAQNMHGATFVVDVAFFREVLTKQNVVVDIGAALEVLPGAGEHALLVLDDGAEGDAVGGEAGGGHVHAAEQAVGPLDPRPTDAESLEIAWVATHAVTDRPLLTAFAAAWPGLRAQVEGSAPVA